MLDFPEYLLISSLGWLFLECKASLGDPSLTQSSRGHSSPLADEASTQLMCFREFLHAQPAHLLFRKTNKQTTTKKTTLFYSTTLKS